jgi:hypothetical protein
MSALFTVESKSGAPTLAQAAATLGLAASALDVGFGVVPIDPKRGLFAVRTLTAASVGGAATNESEQETAIGNASSPFSDPMIEGFGMPRVEGNEAL